MRSCSNQKQNFVFIFVYQQPIRFNMAFPCSRIVASQFVIPNFFFQGVTLSKLLNDFFENTK